MLLFLLLLLLFLILLLFFFIYFFGVPHLATYISFFFFDSPQIRISKDEERMGKPSQRLLRRINFSDISTDEIRSVVERHLVLFNFTNL